MVCNAAKPRRFTRLLLLGCLIAGTSRAEGVLPHFECGEYEVRGHLARNASGHLILTIRHPSRARAELLVMESPSPATEDRLGSTVSAVIEVKKKIEDYRRAEVSILRFLPLKAQAPSSPEFPQLRARACTASKTQ
jgi:hypothetical protein